MVETETTSSWRVYDTLHFVSRRGKPLAVNAWPFPAPLHLSGLILGWPDLSILDRLRVAVGLSQLMMTRSTRDFEQMPALAWLRKHFQNERTIDRFWGTILVSALGDQIDRIAMGPVRKVLVDGFAATRDAFHLLVPTVPLSKLMDDAPRTALSALEVDVRCGCAVQKIQRSSSGTWRIQSDGEWDCDAVVIAVPWYRVNSLLRDAELPTSLQQKLEKVARLQASPITGVHTWWDRPWLRQPHAILIDRLCQWVFPGPEAAANQVPQSEMYYQVVISGSHDLPRGDHESILKEVQKDLQELFPDAKDARLVRGRIVTDPHSVFSVSPSHADSRLTSSAFAVEGIMLAGDWVATGWPATMEGALRSGLLAAQSTLSYLGRPAHLIL
jgi:squalene-associated FAD-dependent desaturase